MPARRYVTHTPRIRDEAWRALAAGIKALKGNRCKVCGIDGKSPHDPLVVHHINCNPHDDRIANLIVLCPKCHERAHQLRLRGNENTD